MIRAIRLLLLSTSFAALLYSCGPDKPRSCSREEPTFEVVLRLTARTLPADTVVHVTYGGSGEEEFRLSDPDARLRVTFCKVADENGVPLEASAPLESSAAGSSGAAGATSESGDSSVVPALYCKLYTVGFTKLEVTGTGFMKMDYDLKTEPDLCTVKMDLPLDAPDAG